MYLDYLKERYELAPEVLENLSKTFEESYAKVGFTVFPTTVGFFVYKLEGDAIIIADIYTMPKVRGTGRGWDLFQEVCKIGLKNGKRVIIGFSEKDGKNQYLGQAAMTAAGFVKAGEIDTGDVYMRYV